MLNPINNHCRNLKNNQLAGPIPSTLTQIPNLKTLWVLISFFATLLKFAFRFGINTEIIFHIIYLLSKCCFLIILLAFTYSDLARNQLTGEIPRLLYWNEVLQYLWVHLSVEIKDFFFHHFVYVDEN